MELLVSGCRWVLPDPALEPITGADILVRDGVIVRVAEAITPPPGARILDGGGCIAIPGLVNTHHHQFQSLTRVVAHDRELFDWLSTLWPLWAGHDAEWQAAATLASCAELLLSGCTTVVDHHYLSPRVDSGDAVQAQAEAAGSLGIRMVQAVGSMDVGADKGGLAPAEMCETADAFIERATGLIATSHDPSPGSMRRIALAPCHPLAVTQAYARGVVELAREFGVALHTHVAEARDEQQATVAATGLRPLELLESWGFLGPEVWLAHAVHLDDADIATLARTETGVATCPSSNLRLGSGIARTRKLIDAGVRLGVGVDGSASNDSGNMLAEVRQLLLSSRAGGISDGLSVSEALAAATTGGASVLGWPSIGRIAEGNRADIALFPTDGIWSVGTEADPVAALVLSPPPAARHVVVEGEVVVRDGALVRGDLTDIVQQARTVISRIAAS